MGFILGAREVHGRCVEGAWEVHGRCTEGVWKVRGRYAGGTRKVRGRCARLFKEVVGTKKSGFYVNEVLNANHLIGCGGDP